MALLSFDSVQQQSSYHPWTEHDPPNDPGPRKPWSSYGLLARKNQSLRLVLINMLCQTTELIRVSG